MAVFTNAQADLVPDPVSYSEWFEQADEKRRRTAVGSRRYSAVRDRLGSNPDWASFLDPETGELLSLDALKAEGEAARMERVNRVRALMQHRRELIRQVGTYGFLLN